jgi:hypothetical protein
VAQRQLHDLETLRASAGGNLAARPGHDRHAMPARGEGARVPVLKFPFSRT